MTSEYYLGVNFDFGSISPITNIYGLLQLIIMIAILQLITFSSLINVILLLNCPVLILSLYFAIHFISLSDITIAP